MVRKMNESFYHAFKMSITYLHFNLKIENFVRMFRNHKSDPSFSSQVVILVLPSSMRLYRDICHRRPMCAGVILTLPSP